MSGIRYKPPPFQRPSVEIGTPKKKWREAAACEIKEGDIVPEIGIVRVVYLKEKTITVHGGINNTRIYPVDTKLWIFTDA